MANNDGPTNRASEANAVAAGAPASLGRRSLPLPYAGIAAVAVFFTLGLVCSLCLRNQPESGDDDIPTAAVEPASPARTLVPTANPLELLTRGDQAMLQHRFGLALSQYDELRAVSADHRPLIEYRYALCNESIGQLDKAIAGYRVAISSAQTNFLAFACHLGLARCLFRQGHYADARRLLYPYFLDESRQRSVPRAFVADTRYLVAFSLSREAAEAPAQEAENEGPIAITAVGLETPYYLEDAGAAGNASARAAEDPAAKPAGQVAQNADKKPLPKRDIVVKKNSDKQAPIVVEQVEGYLPVVPLLERLAAESGAAIQLSAEAKKTVMERSVRLGVRNWLLDELLEPVADNFDLVCRAEGEGRLFSKREELDPKLLQALLRERGVRALRGALVAHAGHAWAAAACLELGNWEAKQGKTAEAAAWFERIVRDSQNSAFVAPAHFNLALLHLGKQDIAAARAAFFRVVDHAPGHELALKAYIRIGQSLLEDDQPTEGIAHLRRAVTTAPRSGYHGRAAVALAAGHLLNNQPDKARAVLAKERTLLQASPCKATAAFLDTYAQFQLAKESSQAKREAADLLSTLWRDQERTVLGPLGDYLIAQAYRDLGFFAHAEQLLRQAGKHARGPLENAVEFALADTLLKQQRRPEAERLFTHLAGKSSPYRARARFQLAQILLQDKRFAECAQSCRELWQEPEHGDATALLRVWGAALENLGEFARAAQCFAGKAPE